MLFVMYIVALCLYKVNGFIFRRLRGNGILGSFLVQVYNMVKESEKELY